MLAAAVLILMPSLYVSAYAIDNPDAPDYVAEFSEQADALESDMLDAADRTERAKASGTYNDFLDAQLNGAYRRLIKRLPAEQREQLQTSQRQWLVFRDAELAFIEGNWVPERFGSSYSLSRSQYRAGVVRARIEQLLWYLKNDP